jgi:ribosome-associated toxin RatA of RatAB toxin-antitoxin module
MIKEIDIKITTSPITDFEDLHNKVDSLLAECNIKMTSLIEEFNVLIQENDEQNEIDTVDLDNKFTELTDYITDYSQ